MIVIIGAGLAGLAAAQKLDEAGHEDFIILEAQDYIGGRVKSIHTHDVRIDLGASWLYGDETNPIYEWLIKKGYTVIGDVKSKEFVMTLANLFATQDGKQVPDALLNPILNSALESKRLFSVASENLISNKPLVNQFQQVLVLSTELSCSENSSRDEKNLKWAIEDWCELHEAIQNSCECFKDLSTRAYTGGNTYDRHKMIKLPAGGWERVVDEMVKSIDLNKVFTNMPVDRVEYSSKSAVVTLKNGMMIECDHVILATPIGTLQRLLRNSPPNCSIKLKMESDRQSLIDRIGFGPATKICLQFEQQFLKESVGLLWTTDPIDVGLPSWTRDLLGFTVVPVYSTKFLLAWVGRSGSPDVEKCSEAEIGETCLKVLKTFLPDKEIPKLIATWTSRWSTNRYIGGANSYPSVRSDEDSHSSLWNPICVPDTTKGDDLVTTTIPRILFAGEATAGEHYGTAHGAIMSGWREADRLIQLLQPTNQETDQ